jgi:hypothetical protein
MDERARPKTEVMLMMSGDDASCLVNIVPNALYI